MPLKILFLSMENIRMVTTPSQSHPQTFWYIRKQKKPMQSTSRTLLFRGLKLWELIRPIFSVFSCNYCVCSVAQSCLTFCDPMDYSLPGSSVHGILQARILDWVAICRNILKSFLLYWYLFNAMRTAASLGKTLMMGKIEGRGEKGSKRMK